MAYAYDPARAERDRGILDDRIKGMSYRALAEKYGCTLDTAYNVVKNHALNTVKPAAEEYVQLEIERLERLLLALDPGIQAGDPKSIGVAVKLSESLRKLTGVDAAIKLEVEHSGTSAVNELEARLRKAMQLNKEE